jgi:hypothetical protein
MKVFIIVSILLGSSCYFHGQKFLETFIIDGNNYYLGEDQLNDREFLELMRYDSAAHIELKKGRPFLHLGNLIGAPGSLFVFVFLSDALDGKKNGAYWPPLAIGVSLWGASIPFFSKYTKHQSNAAHIFEKNLKKTTMTKVELDIGITQQGVGLTIRF